MKKISILFAITAVLFCSCNEDGNGLVGFEIDKASVSVVPEGGTEYLQVTSATEWVAVSDKPWISISPANGIGSTKCRIVVDSTLESSARTATLRFSAIGETPVNVPVTQFGFAKQILVKNPEVSIASATNSVADRYFEATVTSNVRFGVQVEYDEEPLIEWITPEKIDLELDRGSRPRTTTVRFDWKINTDFDKRTARIHFVPLDAADVLENSAILSVTQDAAPTITDDRAGDSLALVTITNRLQLLSPWDVSENMQYWPNITLWEDTDKEIISGEVPSAAVGRVRSANIMMCYTKESLPQEIRYLKYIETLNIYSNVNTMLLSIELGSEVCELEYLKHLQIGAFGLVSLPDDFVNLGDKLESLDLSSNNFEDIPAILTKENFPRLKKLDFIDCRRWTLSNLGDKDSHEEGIGLYFNTNDNEALRRLLLWDTLEELRLSNNYIEGELPTFVTITEAGDTIVDDDVPVWTAEDVAGNDTLKNLVGMPKIMPNMGRLTLNLNFFTGKLPEWVLYHPYLLDWFPESLIYMQKENGIDSNGKLVKFDNEPTDYEYYYNFFPGYREKYEIKEEFED
mgnify:CR=1 FL=1